MKVWSDLNPDLLLSIAKYTTTKDRIVLRAVCKSWGSILLDDKYYISAATLSDQQLPWGLFPCRRLGCCLLYSLSEKQQYLIDLPEFYQYRCCGSSQGWLIFTDTSPAMFMMNPLTRQRIELPPITTILARGSFIEYDESNVDNEYRYTTALGSKIDRDSGRMKKYCISKVILTGNPSFVKDYFIVAASSENNYLGICKAGDDRWTSVDLEDSSISHFMLDIVYWNRSLYGLSQMGHLMKCDDLQSPVPTMKIIARSKTPAPALMVSDFAVTVSSSSSPPNFLVVYRDRSYFVEEEDEERNNNDCFCWGCDSKVYKDSSDPYDDHNIFIDSDVDEDDSDYSSEEELDEKAFLLTDIFVVCMVDEEQQKWIRVRDIGDHALFIGNSSMVVPVQDFPECKPNHIYFSHGYDLWNRPETDMGIMNIKNNKRQPFSGCSKLSTTLPKTALPRFVWFTPSL